uniref:Reverse transcriptase domain-containing protein n=1 Tax=Tanacetum cinerariifolium TaxID=118510 RepID=A0A6L2JE54_TANCI|nr:hypothetical protein [Tanacetum cinerariifolium]
MTRSSTKELFSPLENLKQKYRSKRRLFDTPSLIETNLPEFDQIPDIEEQSEEKVRETMTKTIEQYMSKTRGDYGSGVTRPAINQDTQFELKGQFLKELRDNNFSGSEHKDADEHIKKVLEIVAKKPTIRFDYNMGESAKRYKENSNIIKEIRTSTDTTIRNQETNPKDQVKSISTTKADFSEIRRIRCGPYAISGTQHRSIISKIVHFLKRLQNFGCDDWREAHNVKILEAYDHTLPQTEKDPGSFTLPCFIHNIYFDKALVNLGASVSVMPFSTYTNLSLGILSHTRLIVELANRTIKQPKGIAENVLVKIGKFVFPSDFIILDIPEDNDVPLILGRPFLPSFTIIDGDDVTKDVVLGMKFCKKYASCQMIMKKFALGTCTTESIMNEEYEEKKEPYGISRVWDMAY